MRAIGSHRIVKHGPDKMVLSDCKTGEGVVTARRDGDTWTLTADGAKDITVPAGEKRRDAVDAMITMAFDLLPHEGISVFVPYRHLSPTEKVHLRDEP